MKKTFLTVALLLVGSSNLAQNKRQEPAKPTNRAPVITKFESSTPVVKTCFAPLTDAFCQPRTRRTVTLIVAANDPEGGPLTYEYLTTRGEIVGTGASVSWKLGEQPIGDYSVTVKVLDSKGAEAKSTLNVSVAMCTICGISDPPCPLMSVTSFDESSFRGELLRFHLEVSDGYYQSRPDYVWTVTNGKIIKGQHTLWLTVETTGDVGKKVVAEVAVEGVDAACSNNASSSVLIKQ
jgi:hypothetical protein